MQDIELFHNEWLSLKKIVVPEGNIKGYVYSHETRCDGKIIAVLPYRFLFRKNKIETEFLLRREITPSWHPTEPIYSSITGGWEPKGILQTAVDEMVEETGYIVDPLEMIPLGNSYASKSSDTVYSLFSVNLTDREPGEPTGEDSTPETGSSAVWVTEQALRAVRDPQVAVMLLRLQWEGKV